MLTLSLVTPSKKFLTDVEVEEIFVPAHRGELNILEGHAPLISMLDTGILKYRLKGETSHHAVALSWGYLEVSKDRVTVLAETAESPSSIDVERARSAKDKAEKALSGGDLEAEQFSKYQLKLQRAMLRLQLAQESAGVAADKRGETSH
jgi:F-type H+-transporting ATPase subunit epsilon